MLLWLQEGDTVVGSDSSTRNGDIADSTTNITTTTTSTTTIDDVITTIVSPVPDIILTPPSPYILPQHCVVRHKSAQTGGGGETGKGRSAGSGHVTLMPCEGATCSVNNKRVERPVRLKQGDVIRLGRRHLFRFNDPSEAAHLRQQQPHTVLKLLMYATG